MSAAQNPENDVELHILHVLGSKKCLSGCGEDMKTPQLVWNSTLGTSFLAVLSPKL